MAARSASVESKVEQYLKYRHPIPSSDSQRRARRALATSVPPV
jgi:hypothetical protein